MYGVCPILEEPPDFLTAKLIVMDQELEKLSRQQPAFDLAVASNASYVKSLRLIFLRADRFMVDRAATRMVIFF